MRSHSDHTVISKVDGERVLELGIIDLWRSQLAEAHTRLSLYWYRQKSDVEYGLECYDLDVGYDTGQDRVFFMAPVIVTHHIDEYSLLHKINSKPIHDEELEIVVVLDATLTVQALWSYTEKEILINHSFYR